EEEVVEAEETEEETVESPVLSRELEDTFEFDMKNEQESSSVYEDSPEQLPTLDAADHEEDAESDRWKFMQKTQTFDEFFKKDVEPEVVDEIIDESSSYYETESHSLDESYESRENAD